MGPPDTRRVRTVQYRPVTSSSGASLRIACRVDAYKVHPAGVGCQPDLAPERSCDRGQPYRSRRPDRGSDRVP